MFLNKNLNQRMPKNPLKEIENKRQELLEETHPSTQADTVLGN